MGTLPTMTPPSTRTIDSTATRLPYPGLTPAGGMTPTWKEAREVDSPDVPGSGNSSPEAMVRRRHGEGVEAMGSCRVWILEGWQIQRCGVQTLHWLL